MAIIIVCPQCSTKLSAPDYAAGKLAKCPKAGCGTLIPVPVTVESAAASPLAGLNNGTPVKPARKKTVKAVDQEEAPLIYKIEKLDIDEADEEVPRGKRRRDYEKDEEDELPRKKRRASEDDEEDLPRSKRGRDDDVKRSRPKKKQKSAPTGLGRGAIIGIVGGGITLLIAVIVIGTVLLIKDSGNDKGSDPFSEESSSQPIDASRVTRDNFKSLKAGMTRAEIEDVLGGSRSSSEKDFREALRKNNLGEIEGIMGSYSGLLNEIKSWRRWDGAELIAFVAFVQASDRPRAVYSASLVPFSHGIYMYVHGFSVDARYVEKAAGERKQEVSIRDDKKWVSGAQARELLLGQWRDKNGQGFTFGEGGKITDHSMLKGFGLDPTYQLDDRIVEITRRLPNLPPTTERYEYHVNQDELALVLSQSANSGPRLLYRMPVRAGSAGETNLLGPLLADLKSPDEGKRHQAYMVLYSIGKGAAIALPQLAELLRGENPKVALQATSLIGNMKEEAVSAVPALVGQLRNPTVDRAIASAQALGQIGPPAKEALPALYDAVKKSKDAAIRVAAQDAIRVIEGRKF